MSIVYIGRGDSSYSVVLHRASVWKQKLKVTFLSERLYCQRSELNWPKQAASRWNLHRDLLAAATARTLKVNTLHSTIFSSVVDFMQLEDQIHMMGVN